MSCSALGLATGRSLAVRIDPVVLHAALSPHWLHDALTTQPSNFDYHAIEDSHDDEEH